MRRGSGVAMQTNFQVFRHCVIEIVDNQCGNAETQYMLLCRNWQTRQTQNLLSERVYGFESHQQYHRLKRRQLFLISVGWHTKNNSKSMLYEWDREFARTENLPDVACGGTR